MKKGFTMIELIFVMVVLGILASIPIPRLHGTKEDAEIATAIANLRTLVSDAAAYHAVKDKFADTTKWNEFTNVPLKNNSDVDLAATANATDAAYLAAGKKSCIGVQLVNKNGDVPAHIEFTQNTEGAKDPVCKQVLDSEPVDAYFKSTSGGDKGKMAVGSSKGIYKAASLS